MKKSIKLAVTGIMSFMLMVSSGCSCNLNQKKIDQRSKALSNTVLNLVDDGELTDYLGTVKVVIIKSNMVDQKELVISKDVEGNAYNITTSKGSAPVGENITPTTVNEKIYVVNDEMRYVKGENVQILPTSYQNVDQAYEELISASGREIFKDELANIFWSDISDAYDYYKTIPLNACATVGNPELLPYYANAHRVLECKSKRKLFSKSTTYTVHYRVSIDEFVDVEITTDGNQKILEVKETFTRREETVMTRSLNISYDNIDLTK